VTTDLAAYAPFFPRDPAAVRQDLESFCALVLKWNQTQNLVSRETAGDLWQRHVLDSVQVIKHLRPSDHRLLDLGSGGGFPALALAIAFLGSGKSYTLVESSAKKAAFLRTAVRLLELPDVTVVQSRAEALQPASLPRFDVITSRALAPLDRLLGYAAPFFAPATRAVLHKGREHPQEVLESRQTWDYDLVVEQSGADPHGVLLIISHLQRH